jgi:hypothetical protein
LAHGSPQSMELSEQLAILSERGHLILDRTELGRELVGALGAAGMPERLVTANRELARNWSLSGSFGRGSFPWHTDGAISSNPPRWLVLRPVELSEPTSTELLDPAPAMLHRLARTVLIARDHAGRARYLPARVPTQHGYRLRWDPRACPPRISSIADEVDAMPPTRTVEWRHGRVLVIDNHRLLHRRPAVAPGATRVLQRTYIWAAHPGGGVALIWHAVPPGAVVRRGSRGDCPARSSPARPRRRTARARRSMIWAV